MWCQKSVFQVKSAFYSVSQAENEFRPCFQHGWSGFSFFLFTQNRGIYFGAWFLAPYHITEKVFAKGGLNLTESSISTNRSECFFHETKLQKKMWSGKAGAAECNGFGFYIFNPAFCKYYVIGRFYLNFLSINARYLIPVLSKIFSAFSIFIAE